MTLKALTHHLLFYDRNSQPRLSRQEKIKLQKEKKKEKEQLRKQQAAEQREALKSKNTEQRMKAKERQILEDSEKDIKKRVSIIASE